MKPETTNPIAAQLAKGSGVEQQTVARFLAKYLDEWLRIPGTNKRIGLDPILSLFPGIGDAVVSGAGGIILIEALRSGVPFGAFMRMALNMGVNFLLGLMPGAAPFLTAFFKSNTRNLNILLAWQAGQHGAVRKSTLRFFVGLLVLFGMLTGFLVVIWLFYSWLLYSFLKSYGLLPSWL